jgi:putative redox protein
VLICGEKNMVKVDIEYTGNLHCDATHGPSQSKIATDAPTDNKGRGEAFSPTDLVATALGTCISTTMGLKAEALGVDLKGMTVSVQKEMSQDAPRRIVALPSEVHIPLPPTSPHREVLEQTALNCPVHKSLPAEINRPTKFFWEG